MCLHLVVTVLTILLLCGLQGEIGDLPKSKITLKSVYTESSIPASLLSNVKIGALVKGAIYSGGLLSEDVGECLIHGWEHASAFTSGVFNAFRSQRRLATGDLETISIIYSNIGEATVSVAISPVASRPYIVRSWRLGHSYYASVYVFDPDTCIINPAPIFILDFLTLHPDAYGGPQTCNGFVGFSNDGLYLEYVITLAKNRIVYATKYGFARLNSDGSSAGTSLISVFQFDPPVPSNGFYHPLPNLIMRADKNHGKIFYHVINCQNNFASSDRHAMISAYRFYPDDMDAFMVTGHAYVPHTIQGHALSDDLQDLYTTTNKFPHHPLYSEFRLYRFQKTRLTDSIEFIDAIETDCSGLAVRLSRDNKVLYHTCSVHDDGIISPLGVAVLQSYKIVGNNLDFQDETPIAPLSLNICPSPDDNFVTTVGMPSFGANKRDIVNIAVAKTN